MLNKIFMFITSIRYKEEKAKAWVGIKYLLVHGHKSYDIPHILGDEPCYMTSEFETKQEALDYLDKYVSKNDIKKCRLYKEIRLSPQKD